MLLEMIPFTHPFQNMATDYNGNATVVKELHLGIEDVLPANAAFQV